MTITDDALAAHLEQTGNYRVLRKLRPLPGNHGRSRLNEAVIVDVETTGLDTAACEIIELGAIRFGFNDVGEPSYIAAVLHAYNEPREPISDEITAITGITDDMVRGHRLNIAEIAGFFERAPLIIAHNAEFDRRVIERYWPVCERAAWACSYAEIDWRSEGVESARLGVILTHYGLFNNAHRAVDDCHSLLAILARHDREIGNTHLANLMQRAVKPTWRVWAIDAPFSRKDKLKGRRYRWHADCDANGPRAWYLDTRDIAGEFAWLTEHVYGGRNAKQIALCQPITAADRYSIRAGRIRHTGEQGELRK